MKRFRNPSLALFVTFITLILAACGGGGPSDPGTHNVPPVVATQAAENVGLHDATLRASVNPNGLATTYCFEYGTSPTLAGSTRTPVRSAGSGVANQSYGETVFGLTDNTTYYFRVVADSSAGNVVGTIESCTTGIFYSPPVVQTVGATGISQTGGTGNGQINPNGVSTQGRFRWGYSSAALTNLTPWVALGSGTTSLPINFILTGQNPGTPIYYQAEGNSSAGNTLGSVVSFSTLLPDPPPAVTTLGATGISQTSGTINGQINPKGVATNGRLRWGYSSAALTNLTPWVALGSGTTDVPISFTLTGQSPSTPIYYQAEGNSSGGNVLGAVANFTTSLAVSVPTVVTGSASNITVNSADVSATVNPGNSPTNATIEWGTAADLSTYASAPLQYMGTDSTDHNMSVTLTGLADNTIIYYRVRAWNSVGGARGQILSFVTLPMPVTTVTVNILVYNLDTVIIFRNNQEVAKIIGAISPNAFYQYTGASGDYKFIVIGGGRQPNSLVDINDNNVFHVSASGTLTLDNYITPRVGRVATSFTGSGWTSSYQAPVNVGGVWHIRAVVDDSTNGNAPVGAVGTWDINCTLNEFQVLWVDPGLGLIYGTANGDLIYNWLYGSGDPLWLITWRETLVANSTGTLLTGDSMQTWKARSGTDYFYTHATETGTR